MNALITGASTGIGFAFAKELSKTYNLVLVSQNTKRLSAAVKEIKKNSSKRIFSLSLDLTNPAMLEKLTKFLQQKKLTIDFLINNAGIGFFGEVEKMSDQEINDMLTLNITSLTRLTRFFLPSMKQRKAGKIINVASTAAFQPLPYFAVYSASKSYVLSFTEALYREVENDNIKVLALCPGATKTEFFTRATKKTVLNQTSGLFKVKQFMSSQEVVTIALKFLEKNRSFVIPGLGNYLTAFSSRLFPRRWASWVSKQLLKNSLRSR